MGKLARTLMLTTLFVCMLVPSSLANDLIANSAEQLTYYTEHYPPSNYLEDGEIKGISYETLHLLWQKMGVPPQKVNLVPWARGYRNLIHQKNTMLFTMSRTPEREKLFKWVGPIYEARHVLVAKQSFPYKINTISDVKTFDIAAIRDDISELSLIEAGVKDRNIIKLTNLKQALLMLESERVDMLIISQDGMAQTLKESSIDKSQIKILFTVNIISNYFAFHIQTSDELIKRYQDTFNSLHKERQLIKDKYRISQ